MKKTIALMIASALCVSLVACGNSASKTDENTVTVSESAPAEVVEQESEEETSETDGYNDWLNEHGITIQPQGDFTFTTAIHQNDETVGEIQAPCNISITETTEGCDPGFKKVIGTFVSDMTGAENYGFQVWHSAFDRYTGTSFEFDPNGTTVDIGTNKVRSDSIVIKNGDDEYEVAVSFDSTNNFPEWITIVTVICPENYDGTVFYNGYASLEKAEENLNFDYASQLYTIDEIPYYGDGLYYFFSNTND